MKLVVESKEIPVDMAKSLVEKAKLKLTNTAKQQNIVKLIETIIVHKLPEKSREEIAAMFNLSDLKQTRFYQDTLVYGKQEGKQEAKKKAVARMVKLGLSLEKIAESLDLPLSVVQQIANYANDN